jgi:hypothetical protein
MQQQPQQRWILSGSTASPQQQVMINQAMLYAGKFKDILGGDQID